MSALHFHITHSLLHCQWVWASRSLTWQGGSPVEGCVSLMSCDLSTLGSHSWWAACRCCTLSLRHGFIWPSSSANANLGGERVWLCCQIPFFAEQLEGGDQCYQSTLRSLAQRKPMPLDQMTFHAQTQPWRLYRHSRANVVTSTRWPHLKQDCLGSWFPGWLPILRPRILTSIFFSGVEMLSLPKWNSSNKLYF